VICILRSLIWCLTCIITDIVISNGIQSSVILQLLQSLVKLFCKVCIIFGKTDCILLFVKNVLNDLKIIVFLNKFLSRLAVDHYAVNLTLFQSHNSVITFVVSLHCCVFNLCSVCVTGCSKLNTDLLTLQIICALDLICCKNSGCHRNCHSCCKCKCHKFSLHFFFLLNSMYFTLTASPVSVSPIRNVQHNYTSPCILLCFMIPCF